MILTLVWLFFVLLISIIPTNDLPTENQTDKIVHFIIYGITALLFLKVLRLRTTLTKSIILSVGLASFFGLAMELLQSVLPWRELSLLDELANIGGAFSFSIIYALRDYYKKKL